MASENEKPDDALLGALKAALDYAGTPPPPRCPECARLTKERDAALAERDEARKALEESEEQVGVLRRRNRVAQEEAAKTLDAALATAQARDEVLKAVLSLLEEVPCKFNDPIYEARGRISAALGSPR